MRPRGRLDLRFGLIFHQCDPGMRDGYLGSRVLGRYFHRCLQLRGQCCDDAGAQTSSDRRLQRYADSVVAHAQNPVWPVKVIVDRNGSRPSIGKSVFKRVDYQLGNDQA